jgi:hypothetical protein
VGLAELCIRASCPKGGGAVDSYMISVSSGVVAIATSRGSLGVARVEKQWELARASLLRAYDGRVQFDRQTGPSMSRFA